MVHAFRALADGGDAPCDRSSELSGARTRIRRASEHARGQFHAMNPLLPTHGRTRGFTLLELLIAVAVFAIVLAAINAVFYGALRLRNKTTEAIKEALPMQQALAI